MNKNVKSVEQYVAYNSNRKRFEVKINKVLTIFLFSVGMTAATAETVYNLGLPKDEAAEITLMQQQDVVKEVPTINLSLRDNITGVSDRLQASLMIHRGGLLLNDQIAKFKQVVSQLQDLKVADAFVRYNETEHHISYDLLLDNDLILHLTQYFDQPSDQLVYSIERDDIFRRVGYAPIEGFGRFISEVIDEVAVA